MLAIEHLNFEYAGRPLFRQFSLQLAAGITWLRGENGAGKTTLMKLVAGALLPHTGAISVAGIDSARQPLAYRRQVHYCGGDTPALPWLTVREMFDLHLALYPGADAALLNAELDAFRLHGVLEQPVTTLSLGQHKKMQLSLALALPVTVLLIDEPFNGLDTAAVAYLRSQLASRGNDSARRTRQCIVLTSHLEPDLPLSQTIQL
jgi:ABC-2 type transport system ATP-binding protein